MHLRIAAGSIALTLGFGIAVAAAQPVDPAKYPDVSGKWMRASAGTFDPDKPPGLGQQAPLIDEYQKILERSVAEQAAGGQGNNPMAACTPPGMPRMMIGYGGGMEIVVAAKITYMLMGEPMLQLRRIYTDGRPWPEDIDPTFSGYSIGEWKDEDGDGRFDVLTIETRSIKFPRSYDSSGLPFHKDGEAVVKERVFLDKTSKNTLRDEITVIDHALTRPWTVTRTYKHEAATWMETICGEDEHQVKIGKEQYYLSGDGKLMPTRKNQPPPDLTYFKEKSQ